jgi:hypothetical protein
MAKMVMAFVCFDLIFVVNELKEVVVVEAVALSYLLLMFVRHLMTVDYLFG